MVIGVTTAIMDAKDSSTLRYCTEGSYCMMIIIVMTTDPTVKIKEMLDCPDLPEFL